MHRVSDHSCSTCKGVVQPGKYCTDCGLHNIGKKTGFIDFIREGFEQVVSLENGFIIGIKNSLVAPRSLVLDYYYGYRNHSPSPGKMVLYTLFALGTLYLIFGEIDFFDVTISGEEKNDFNAVKIFMIILIPFIIFSSKILYWRKFRGIVVHMMSTAFLFLPRFIVLILITSLAGFFLVENATLLNVALLFTLLWFFYANAALFNIKGVFRKSLYAIANLAIFLGLMVFTILLLLLFATAEVHFQ